MKSTVLTYYQILGVAQNADSGVIKVAFKKLSFTYHPDRNPKNANAEAKFKAVTTAYSVLNDEAQRALYDEFGEDGLAPGFDPVEARAEARRSLDPRRHPADHIHDAHIAPSLARAGGQLKLMVNRTVECWLCRGSGSMPVSCDLCDGCGLVTVENVCVYCDGSPPFWDGYVWLVCSYCDGLALPSDRVRCEGCEGHGHWLHACPICKQGKITTPIPLKVRVPANVEAGQFLRIPRMSPIEGGDLFVRMNIAPEGFPMTWGS